MNGKLALALVWALGMVACVALAVVLVAGFQGREPSAVVAAIAGMAVGHMGSALIHLVKPNGKPAGPRPPLP